MVETPKLPLLANRYTPMSSPTPPTFTTDWARHSHAHSTDNQLDRVAKNKNLPTNSRDACLAELR
eukprot:3136914-Alexandrium_andersonii.AAC.1